MKYLFVALFTLLTVPAFAVGVWQDDNCNDGFFVRGDTQGDGHVDNTDAINIFNYLYNGWGDYCEVSSLDINDDGFLNDLDGILLLQYLNTGEWGPPPAPFGVTQTRLDGGLDCTPGSNPTCRHSPVVGLSPKLSVKGIVEQNSYFQSCTPAIDLTIWDTAEVEDLGDGGARVTVERDRDCYQKDACAKVTVSFDIEDNHWTTWNALFYKSMALYTKFHLVNIEFGPQGETGGDTTFCLGQGSPQYNILQIFPDAELEFVWINDKRQRGFYIKDNGVKGEFDQDAYRVYRRDGDFLVDPGLPEYPDGATSHPGPVSIDHCYKYDVDTAKPVPTPSAYHLCDYLRLSEVRITIPLYHFTFGQQDVIYEFGGTTESIQFDIYLHEVEYEYPWCPSRAPHCSMLEE